jgi:hypothetical protein
LTLASLGWLILVDKSAQAKSSQLPNQWTQPMKIATTPGVSQWPAVVADKYGFVHVFWSETDNAANEGSSMYYSRWNGRRWSDPIDIQIGGQVFYPAVTIDPEQRIHLVWEDSGHLYYSSAPSDQAETAHGWSPPQDVAAGITGGWYPFAIVSDSAGQLYIGYASQAQGNGIYVMTSADGGGSWQSPVLVADMADSTPGIVRLASDPRGRIHIVWGTAPRSGLSDAVYYAHSTDRGKLWTTAMLVDRKSDVDYKTDWINVAVVGNDEIHLVWMSGPRAYRFHRWSGDGGTTWSEPKEIFPDWIGESGGTELLTDNRGNLHAFSVMRRRNDSTRHGLIESVWQSGKWSAASWVTNASLWLAATIVNGNQVIGTYENESEGDILYVTGQIATTYTPPATRPTPYHADPVEALTGTAIAAADTARPTPHIESSVLPVNINPAQAPNPNSSSNGIIVSTLVPALMTVLVALSIIFLRGRGK